MKYLVVMPIVLSIFGCVSSPYDDFINAMSIYTNKEGLNHTYTINELDFDPNYPHGYAAADSEYLLYIERLKFGQSKYHFKRPNIWNTYCYYYFIVEDATSHIIGWGFDYDKADPQKTCGRSG